MMDKKGQWMGHVTVQGSVTFNGPMFDIHDNQNVHIHHGKEEVTPSAAVDEGQQELVEVLKPMFYGSVGEARAFLQGIQGMKATQVTDRVNQLVTARKLSEISKHRDLWKVLHDNGLYLKSESNWNQQVK